MPFGCVLRCKGETLHKVSVNTPKRRCVHIFFRFEPTWLSCRNCFRGIDIFMFVDYDGFFMSEVSAVVLVCMYLQHALCCFVAHNSWNLREATMCEFTRSDCWMAAVHVRRKRIPPNTGAASKWIQIVAGSVATSSFKTNNLHRRVTKMGAKNFFLRERRWHHVRGILRLFTFFETAIAVLALAFCRGFLTFRFCSEVFL